MMMEEFESLLCVHYYILFIINSIHYK
jgi:hypothetical protein